MQMTVNVGRQRRAWRDDNGRPRIVDDDRPAQHAVGDQAGAVEPWSRGWPGQLERAGRCRDGRGCRTCPGGRRTGHAIPGGGNSHTNRHQFPRFLGREAVERPVAVPEIAAQAFRIIKGRACDLDCVALTAVADRCNLLDRERIVVMTSRRKGRSKGCSKSLSHLLHPFGIPAVRCHAHRCAAARSASSRRRIRVRRTCWSERGQPPCRWNRHGPAPPRASGPAPPKAIRVELRPSMPRSTVMRRNARNNAALATLMTPKAASTIAMPMDSDSWAIASRAAAMSRRSVPPMTLFSSMYPSTRLASVTVGHSPPLA